MAPAVNPQDLQSVGVACSCNHASCWDDNLSRNQVFFVSGLNHQTQPSPGPHDFFIQQVAAPCPISETKLGLTSDREVGGPFQYRGFSGQKDDSHADTAESRQRADLALPPEASGGAPR